MPFVEIYCGAHFTTVQKQHISKAIHEALVETIHIPENDLFQVFRSVPKDDLLFPETYMGIPHSNNILYIRITLRTGRSAALKQALYEKMAENIAERTPVSPDDVMIIMVENNDTCWSLGRGQAQYLNLI